MNIGDLARFQPRIGILVPAKLHEQVYLDIHYGFAPATTDHLHMRNFAFIVAIWGEAGQQQIAYNSFKLSMNRTF